MRGTMAEESSLRSLVDKARTGDREAFEELVGSYGSRLHAAVEMQIQRGGLPLEAEEVFQETMVRAFQSIGRFEWQGEDSFYQWLCGISRNVGHKLRERYGKNRDLHVPERIAAGGASPSKVLRREERFDRLEKSLAKLSFWMECGNPVRSTMNRGSLINWPVLPPSDVM